MTSTDQPGGFDPKRTTPSDEPDRTDNTAVPRPDDAVPPDPQNPPAADEQPQRPERSDPEGDVPDDDLQRDRPL